MEDACRIAATRAARMWCKKDYRGLQDVIDGHIFYYVISDLTFIVEYMGSYTNDQSST